MQQELDFRNNVRLLLGFKIPEAVFPEFKKQFLYSIIHHPVKKIAMREQMNFTNAVWYEHKVTEMEDEEIPFITGFVQFETFFPFAKGVNTEKVILNIVNAIHERVIDDLLLRLEEDEYYELSTQATITPDHYTHRHMKGCVGFTFDSTILQIPLRLVKKNEEVGFVNHMSSVPTYSLNKIKDWLSGVDKLPNEKESDVPSVEELFA